ncbi:hypothetical protein [Alkalihalobacillus sp. LMS39]|uniref:hypothetical protein n=1 Tax=Alkalihalobacillus sp. LMS39 TaxID=2924032 RepID=UPI001FB362A9|nr:hypothetical protein [Alkalihalobacillus sp. LMS39]UOE92674.1 hypothetical protein MM271_15705 [Alkalihalobacillus sp. LMS39]
MDNINAEKIIILENGEEKIESTDSGFKDIDEAVEYFLEYDTSNFPINANKVTFNLYEDDYPHTVMFSKFKDKWYRSEYRINFKGYYLNDLLFSVDGNEIDIANYLYKNIDNINSECNLELDTEYLKSKIEPDDLIIEELMDKMNTNKAKFELLDI